MKNSIRTICKQTSAAFLALLLSQKTHLTNCIRIHFNFRLCRRPLQIRPSFRRCKFIFFFLVFRPRRCHWSIIDWFFRVGSLLRLWRRSYENVWFELAYRATAFVEVGDYFKGLKILIQEGRKPAVQWFFGPNFELGLSLRLRWILTIVHHRRNFLLRLNLVLNFVLNFVFNFFILTKLC